MRRQGSRGCGHHLLGGTLAAAHAPQSASCHCLKLPRLVEIQRQVHPADGYKLWCNESGVPLFGLRG
jgi:hypothetical protein